MPKIEELKKEAEENLDKFSKELQLLNQRESLVTQEIIRLQGEIRGFTKLLQPEKESMNIAKNEKEKN